MKPIVLVFVSLQNSAIFSFGVATFAAVARIPKTMATSTSFIAASYFLAVTSGNGDP